MTDPVDLANFREMTGSDPDIERELFEEFIISFENGIDILKKNCTSDTPEMWRTESHALKGIALNLGAQKLGARCEEAQNMAHAPGDVKELLIKQISTEYGYVKKFIENCMSNDKK